MPENLKLNTFLQEFHSDCTHSECRFGFYGFAFGQSPFPVPKLIQDALIKNVNKGQYAAVPGVPQLRNAISKYNKHYFGINDRGAIMLLVIILFVLHVRPPFRR